MKVTVEMFNERVGKFVDQVVVPSAKRPTTLAKIGFAKGFGMLTLSPKHAEKLQAYGIMDEAGEIDVDRLRKGAECALELAGKVPVDDLGLSFNKAEVEKFFKVLETGQVS